MKVKVNDIKLTTVSTHLFDPSIVYYTLIAEVVIITDLSLYIPQKPKLVQITNTFSDIEIKNLYERYIGKIVELGYIDGIYPILNICDDE